jgi:DNA-binding transcriptional regulator YdaS (Cro superfamily)
MRLRAALRNLRALPMYGTWPKVALALGVKPELLHSIIGGRSHPSPAVALLVARAARSTVERILEAGPAAADRCPHCGRTG